MINGKPELIEREFLLREPRVYVIPSRGVESSILTSRANSSTTRPEKLSRKAKENQPSEDDADDEMLSELASLSESAILRMCELGLVGADATLWGGPFRKMGDLPPTLADFPTTLRLEDFPPKLADLLPRPRDLPPMPMDLPPRLGDLPPRLGDLPPRLGDLPPRLGDLPPRLGDLPLR